MALTAAIPRYRPTVKCLLFTVADYGTFPIWHRETDLHMMNLQTGKIDATLPSAPDKSDTYHSWKSSNSHWFVFASKRDDPDYTESLIFYVDSTGKSL